MVKYIADFVILVFILLYVRAVYKDRSKRHSVVSAMSVCMHVNYGKKLFNRIVGFELKPFCKVISCSYDCKEDANNYIQMSDVSFLLVILFRQSNGLKLFCL